MDESLIIEIWDTFREFVPTKHRDTAANQYVDFLIGKDVDAAALESFLGFDPYLDDAIKSVLAAEDQIDADDFPEEDED